MFSDVQEAKNDWRIIRVPVLALLVTMVLMLASSSQASAQNKLIPEIKLGDANIKLWGYTHLLHDSNSDDWNIPNVRLRTKVDYGKFGFFGEVNFAHTQRKDVNWLRLAYLIYNVNSDWEVHLGRVFLSAGKMTPPPFVLETVQYPIADMY